MIVLVKLQDV